MSVKKSTLGKGLGDLGLSELLGDINTAIATPTSVVSPPTNNVAETVTATTETPASVDGVTAPPTNAGLKTLPVDVIRPGRYQPRKTFDEAGLQELADSIKAQGIIQPIVLRRMNDGYEIIAGERRWRAAQKAGLQTVPVIIRDISDEAAIAMALIENIQRRDLNAIEEAEALNRLILEFKLTHQEVAEAVGKSRTVVTNLLRLLKLNPDVRTLLEAGDIEMGHARALLALEGLAQSKVSKIVVSKALSVRQTEQLIRRYQSAKAETSEGAVHSTDPDILSLQNRLSEQLGADIQIQHTAKGKGRVLIKYNSVEELQGILEHIQ